MYITNYDLAERPFEINTDPRFLWLGEIHKEALAVLKYGVISPNGILVITGDTGTGKTTLINALLEDLDDEIFVAKILNSNVDLTGFLSLIGQSLHISRRFNKIEDFIFYFTNFLEHKRIDRIRVLLIVDEAHKLSQEILEQIRLLSNIEHAGKNLVNIYLIGQNELNKNLLSPKCRALRQRIAIHHQIKPLSESETLRYCLHRLKVAGSETEIFSRRAITEIYRFSGGYPRLINIICDRALITGYAAGVKKITSAMIRECSRELRLPGEFKLNLRHELSGLLNSISGLLLQPKMPIIYPRIKKQAKHSLVYFFNQWIAGPVFRLSQRLAGTGNPAHTEKIKISALRKAAFNIMNQRQNIKAFFNKYIWQRRTRDILSGWVKSGLWKAAIVTGLVALIFLWSLKYQGISSTEPDLQLSDRYALISHVPTLDEATYHAAPLPESNRVDATETEQLAAQPSGNLEPAEPALEDKYKADTSDDFAEAATTNMGAMTKTGPSISNTAALQLSSRKSTAVDRQYVEKTGPSIGFPRRSKDAYSIQVGAFLHKDNAVKTASLLGRKGYSASIVKFNDSKGRIWYTVRIGEYDSRSLAGKHAADFTSKQGLDSIVRPVGRF